MSTSEDGHEHSCKPSLWNSCHDQADACNLVVYRPATPTPSDPVETRFTVAYCSDHTQILPKDSSLCWDPSPIRKEELLEDHKVVTLHHCGSTDDYYPSLAGPQTEYEPTEHEPTEYKSTEYEPTYYENYEDCYYCCGTWKFYLCCSPACGLYIDLDEEVLDPLQRKIDRAHSRDNSRVKRVRARREHVGNHNWSRAWNPEPGPVQPKTSARQWVESENRGDLRTAARLSWWKGGFCSCYYCADLHSTLLTSYTRLQKANLHKLVRRYQAANNGERTPFGMHHGQTRKGTDWTDFAWELGLDHSDEEPVWDGEDRGDLSSSAARHTVDLMELLKPAKPAKKRVKPMPLRASDEEYIAASPTLSVLSSDWDDVSVVSMDEFVLI